MSIAPASIWPTNSAALAGDQIVSEVTMAVRASAKRAWTSSAIRSTPGPTGTRLSSSWHSGQRRGGGMIWPQWWQARRWTSRGSTIQAVQFGPRSEEHTSELQSRQYLVSRLLLEKK